MISYHPTSPDVSAPKKHTKGFVAVDTNDVNRIAECMRRFVWSPNIWRGGYRKQDNFISCEWCVLDFDDGEMTLDEAVNTFCDMIHIIGTTKNHQKSKGGIVCDRYRVVLKFDSTITDHDLYKWNMKGFYTRYPCDKACLEGGRFFFPCRDIVSLSPNGYTEAVKTDVPKDFGKRIHRYSTAYARIDFLPESIKWRLNNIIPIGERNNWVYKIAIDLAECGYDYDEIVHKILASATYSGCDISPDTMDDILKAARNGFIQGLKNKAP